LNGFDGPTVDTEYELVLDPIVDADILENIATNQVPEAEEPGVEVADPLDINIPDGVVIDLDPK